MTCHQCEEKCNESLSADIDVSVPEPSISAHLNIGISTCWVKFSVVLQNGLQDHAWQQFSFRIISGRELTVLSEYTKLGRVDSWHIRTFLSLYIPLRQRGTAVYTRSGKITVKDRGRKTCRLEVLRGHWNHLLPHCSGMQLRSSILIQPARCAA